MAVDVVTSTEVGILRFFDESVGEVFLTDFAGLLEDIDHVHKACCWLLAPEDARQLRLAGFFGIGLPIPKLVVRDVRIGSLFLEITQAAGAPAVAGAAIWLTARVLREGPGRLHEWAGLLPKARAEWYREQGDVQQERARLRGLKEHARQEQEVIFEAHESALAIMERAPKVEVRVVNAAGNDAAEPETIFLVTDRDGHD